MCNDTRPPHDVNNYPCGFSDCIYCNLRQILETNLHELHSTITQEVLNCMQAPQ